MSYVLNQESFIVEQNPSSSAAAMRLTKTEEFLLNWRHEMNATDTKKMPDELKNAYQIAFQSIGIILEKEKEIVLRGEKYENYSRRDV